MFLYNSEMFYKHIWNVLQTYMKCFETIWNIIQTNLKYFLIIQNIMKCLTLFIGNFPCSQTNQHVPEHSEMFQKKVLNVSELFPNVLMFQYNSEMFLQTYMQYFTTIFEIFWNNLKYFQTNLKIFFNHSKHYKVFNTIYWVLFMQTLTACSAELKWLGWR